MKLLDPNNHDDFFSLGLEDWISKNLSSKEKNWNSKFALMCWLNWKHRNEQVFNNKQGSVASLMCKLEYHLSILKESGLLNGSSVGPNHLDKEIWIH
ncbi:uncharacterized protein G2W53_019201 [Senna tora]|uniref:Uncharacterized protein n=1 Tax=Senna tora TaxID=362788 RepID=A0A834WM42_9FABA|nr:uncharacterized protein G2W53_019201 [Senna tora]